MALKRVPGDPRCLAFLTVCVALSRKDLKKAESLAREILRDNPREPASYYALGRIHLCKGNRKQAFGHFEKATRLAGGDADMQTEIDRMEPRRAPVLGFLSRNHPLNVWLGKVRAGLGRK